MQGLGGQQTGLDGACAWCCSDEDDDISEDLDLALHKLQAFSTKVRAMHVEQPSSRAPAR